MGVETALTAAGLGLSAVGTATSFIDAGRQRSIQAKAEADADKAVERARKEVSVNNMEGLSINKEPYEKEREALISAGAQAIEAGRESNRGVASVAGRVQMAQNEGQSNIRAAMGNDEKQLDMLTAKEDSRIKDILTQISLQEAVGNQWQARDADLRASMGLSSGLAGVGQMIDYAAKLAPLYGKKSGSVGADGKPLKT